MAYSLQVSERMAYLDDIDELDPDTATKKAKTLDNFKTKRAILKMTPTNWVSL